MRRAVGSPVAICVHCRPRSDSVVATWAERLADRIDPPARSITKYRHDLPGFARECIKWGDGGPVDYQEEIWGQLEEQERISVRAPHGAAKSTIAAITVLWFALTRDGDDWKCPTTASAWRQLEKYLWPEIHKWARLLDWEKIGRPAFSERDELLDLNLKLTTGSAFALASDKPDSLEGAHADHILYVLDEGKAIPKGVFESVEGAFSGPGEALALLLSVPGEPVGRFYDIQSRKPGTEDWWTRHVTLGEAVKAGRISQSWADQRAKDWGKESAAYKNRVLGEFASSDEDGIIPLAWVEAANDRWRELPEGWKVASAFKSCGVDVARSGTDETVIAVRYANAVAELRRSSLEDTVQTTSRVQAALTGASGGQCWVDVIGIGAGVFDALRHQRTPPSVRYEAFNASERTERRDKSREFGFLNVRAAAWWNMREMLDPTNDLGIALPPDDMLTGDLCAPHWWVAAGAKIQVEAKDDIRKRLGRSPDSGDAVVQCFWAVTTPARAFGSQVARARLPI